MEPAMNWRKWGGSLGLVLVMAVPAWAHPGHLHTEPTGHGFAAGFFHPLFGLDHLLAMVAVGLLAAQWGGRALWALPAAFLSFMVLGGCLGMAGLTLPGLEIGIALSVVVLGAALLVGKQSPLLAAAIVAGLMGLLHGHAHGAEMPALATSQQLLYAMGFVLSTTALHGAGLAVGLLLVSNQKFSTLLRLSGAAITVAGVLILARLI
jgi:urease accessory protein